MWTEGEDETISLSFQMKTYPCSPGLSSSVTFATTLFNVLYSCSGVVVIVTPVKHVEIMKTPVSVTRAIWSILLKNSVFLR